jgi:hypothetical protein
MPIAVEPVLTPPIGSLVMLAYLSGLKLDVETAITLEQLNLLNPLHCFFMLLQTTLQAINPELAEGDSLEVFLEWWIKCRIAAACATGKKSIGLNKLFPFLTNLKSGEVSLPEHISKTSKYFVAKSDTLPLISSPTKSMTDIAKSFNERAQFPITQECVMFESLKGQGFDLLLAFMSGGRCHVLIFDAKSAEVIPSSSNETVKPTTLKCDQFTNFLKLIDALKELSNTTELSSICQALVEGNYHFIYLTTYADVKPDKNTDLSKHPNLKITKKADAKEFFGMMWPVVKSFRSMSSKMNR